MSREKRYWHDMMGFNYRMTNLQAALGVAQLESIADRLSRRAEILAQYRQAIDLCDGVRLNFTADWAKNAYWMTCLEVDRFDSDSRDLFMQRLKARGIDSRPYFYPMSRMPMYKDKTPPQASAKSVVGINLPTYHDLSGADIQRIGQAVNEELRALFFR
jgi:perosamine synthetase